MRSQSIQNGQPLPYMYGMYNLKILYTPFRSHIRPFLAKIINALAKALNDKENEYQLPKYVIIILNKDLLINAEVSEFEVAKTIEDCLKWLLININLMLETHKEDLMKKHPGAVPTATEPRLI